MRDTILFIIILTKIVNNYIIIKIMNKEDIRRKILKKRLSLPSKDIEDKSRQIFLHLTETVEYKIS